MFQKTYKFSLMFSTTGLTKGFWIHTGNVVFVIIAFFSCLHLQQHTNLTFPNVKSLLSPKWRTTDDLERLPPLTKGPRKNWKPAAWRHEFNPGILFANQPERWLNQRPRPQQSPSKKNSPSFWTPRAPCLGGGKGSRKHRFKRQESKEREVTCERRRFFRRCEQSTTNRKPKKNIKGLKWNKMWVVSKACLMYC